MAMSSPSCLVEDLPKCLEENGCLELVSQMRDTNTETYLNSISPGVLITAVFTLLTPLAANAGLPFLYAVRIIEVSDIC